MDYIVNEVYTPEEAHEAGYHLGFADGEGSIEGSPNEGKFWKIEEYGWKRAESQVLYLHKPGANHNGYFMCLECDKSWPCPTAIIFLGDPNAVEAPFEIPEGTF